MFTCGYIPATCLQLLLSLALIIGLMSLDRVLSIWTICMASLLHKLVLKLEAWGICNRSSFGGSDAFRVGLPFIICVHRARIELVIMLQHILRYRFYVYGESFISNSQSKTERMRSCICQKCAPTSPIRLSGPSRLPAFLDSNCKSLLVLFHTPPHKRLICLPFQVRV